LIECCLDPVEAHKRLLVEAFAEADSVDVE
jgi:hypothetical protein